MSNILSSLLIAATLTLSSTGAHAEYPASPITYVIPFAPGGAADHAGRLLAEGLGKVFGKSVVAENRPGANGIIGATSVAQAKADGYTLLQFNSTLALNSILYKETKYDSAKDFTPIGFVARQPYLIAVSNKLPVKTLDELIKLAKEKDGKLTYATGGTAHQLVGELLEEDAGIKLTHVPYDSTSLAFPDVISGRVDIIIAAAFTAQPHLGSIRALATTGAQRAALLPDVPTLKELGHEKLVVEGWLGVVAPAGTPEQTVSVLGTALKTYLDDPSTQDAFRKSGFEAAYLPSQEFGKLVASEIARDRQALAAAGIKPQ